MSRKVARVIAAVCHGYWRYLLIVFLFVSLPFLGLALLFGISGVAFWLLAASAAPLALLIAMLILGYTLARDVSCRLPENNYGLCSGSSNGMPDDAGILPLTDWLHEFFQTVAGRKAQDTPVTFGELWDNGGDANAPRDIELVLMTTNITRGISQRLPFLEGSWGQLFFNEEHLAQLFPSPIVNWMTKCAQEPRRKEVEVPKGYFGLPKPGDLPILSGVRMSLSFPFLLSAVPLYAANVLKKREDGKFLLERCWFSDGGLVSDFRYTFLIRLYQRDRPSPSISSRRLSRRRKSRRSRATSPGIRSQQKQRGNRRGTRRLGYGLDAHKKCYGNRISSSLQCLQRHRWIFERNV